MASASVRDALGSEGGCRGWKEPAFSKGVTFTQLQLMVDLENFRPTDASFPDILREPGHQSFFVF